MLSGELRAEGVDNDIIAAVIDPAAPDAALSALAQALQSYPVVLYQRIFSQAVAEALREILPQHTLIAVRGEHAFDPPADHVLAAPATDLVLNLLKHATGAEMAAPGRGSGTALLPESRLVPPRQRAFTPNLEPVWIGPKPEQSDFFVLHGNAGCPYQNDARDNEYFSGVELPRGVGRGCGFCAAGNSYEALSLEAALERVLEQVRYLRQHAPNIERLVLKDQNPFAYLEQLFDRAMADNLTPFTLLLETRADWFLRAQARVERILKRLRGTRFRLAPYLVGIENFSPVELARMNKGLQVETHVEFLAWLRKMVARYPDVLDLSHSAFGFVLLTPWTTRQDLELNLDGIQRTRLHELRGELLLSRLRLYPDNALYYLAQRDGLLTDAFDEDSEDASKRYGYFPATPWRFRDPYVARFSRLAGQAHEAVAGRDEPKLFAALLDALDAGTKPEAVTLSDVLARMRSAQPSAGAAAAGRTVQAHLPGGCRLSCPVCDCEDAPGRPKPKDAMRAGGSRVELRGGTEPGDGLAGAIAAARDRGFSEVVVRTPALCYAEPDSADWLASAGADSVLVPVFSHRADVHDRISGRRGSLVRSLAGMRALDRAGVGIEVEIPLLAPTLSHLGPILDLLERAVSRVRRVHLRLPDDRRARALLPQLTQVAAHLPQLLTRLKASRTAVSIVPSAGVPLCAVHPHSELLNLFAKQSGATDGLPRPCRECSLADSCAGPNSNYRQTHGSEGLIPFQQVAGGARRQLRRRSARLGAGPELFVIRPTVHCNQDCGFCSANQTSKNAYEDPRSVMRAIVRAAGRGVPHLSFSGGEPTLSKELVDYIRLARRLGVPKIEIVTNGVLLDRQDRVQRLVDAGLSHAFVSLHADSERVSRALTRKDGDFDRTCRAIEELSEQGVRTAINHVITAASCQRLEQFVQFVAGRFGSQVMISFAFLTPEYRALDNLSLMPRYAEVWPHLRRAMHRAVDLGQPVNIGSRQGIPPCQLGEFVAWSDALWISNAALHEDLEHKLRGAQCDECRFSQACTGVWRPYAERYGLGELRALPGLPLSGDVAKEIATKLGVMPWGVPRGFEDVPAELRDHVLEQEGRALYERDPSHSPEPSNLRRLPVVSVAGRRPLRLALFGSGGRALDLRSALPDVAELALDSVASPRGPNSAQFGHVACYGDPVQLLEERRPDAAVIATPTHTHGELVRACLDHGVPFLVEKPLCHDVDEARALQLLVEARGVAGMAAHQLTTLPGVRELASEVGDHLFIRFQVPPDALDAPNSWHPSALFQQLHHSMELACHVAGGAEFSVDQVQLGGTARPERIRARLIPATPRAVGASDCVDAAPEIVVDLSIDYAAARSVLELSRGQRRVLRTSAGVEVRNRGQVRGYTGSDRAWLLRAFAEAVRTRRCPVPLSQAVATLATTHALLRALADAGAPLDPQGAPRRTASRAWRGSS